MIFIASVAGQIGSQTDPPYSASKAVAELIIASYRASFFRGHPVKIASCRAGNVIGGGDWAKMHRVRTE